MGTPSGDFIRARRDSVQPQSLGLPDRERRRAPGLRRSDLPARAGVSVEYLTRLEQGHDRNPSVAVVNALAEALALDPPERDHLRHLSKITGGECVAQTEPAPPRRDVRPAVLRTLALLEPGIAMVTNRLGDVLARTGGFEAVARGTGLLDAPSPNLTRYVFTDPGPVRSSPTGTRSRTNGPSSCGAVLRRRASRRSPRSSRRPRAPSSPAV